MVMQLEDRLRFHRETPGLRLDQSIPPALRDSVLYVVAPELSVLRRTGAEPHFRLFETPTRRVVIGHSSDGVTSLLWVFSSAARAERWVRGRAGLCAEPIPGPTAVGLALAAGSGIVLDAPDGAFVVGLTQLRSGAWAANPPSPVDLASALAAWSSRRIPRLLVDAQTAFRDSVLFVNAIDASVARVGAHATTVTIDGRRILLKRTKLGPVLDAQVSREHAILAAMPGLSVIPVDGPTLAGWAFESACDLQIHAGSERVGMLPFEELATGWSRRTRTTP